MRGLTHRWLIPDAPRHDPIPSVEPVVARCLAARGLSPTLAADFLNPRLTDMHDPDTMPGLVPAAHHILDAVSSGAKTVIYADYDVDGLTAAAILEHTLRHLRPDTNISTYIPHRLDEGYGLNPEAIRSLATDGAQLIISVDCGITAVPSASAARDAGVDLIITDHHNPPSSQADLPDARHIVHPRLPGAEPYPCPHLCGAAVAFKLAWKLATLRHGSSKVTADTREILLDNLALAALGTIADVVPLVDENRIIARHGLARLPHCNLIGLHALADASNLADKRIESEDVGFRLAPRLNACGRMGHAAEALELLTTQDLARARTIAIELSKLNNERRATEQRITTEALARAESLAMTSPETRAIVLASEGWHPGVVGIACSRLVARHNRPTILMNHEGDLCKGSARSIDSFSIHDALTRCADLLETFGGHDMAAGLSLKPDNLDAFVQRFTDIANESITTDMLVPSLRIDCEATLDELSPAAIRQLEQLGPFGRDNPSPVILLRNLALPRDPEPFGSRQAHLSVNVRNGRGYTRLVAWSWGDRANVVRAGQSIDAVVEPRLNTWKGRARLEPVVKDIRPLATT